MWAVAFSKQTLLVTDWNETLSFYNIQGQQIFKERNIGNAIIIIFIVAYYTYKSGFIRGLCGPSSQQASIDLL